jgi:Polyketide cyclase / dehydrase and lipid transport
MASEAQIDDAPLTTSKRDEAVDAAKAAIPEAKGDTLVGRSVTINRPSHELYNYWRHFGNLATFMENIVRIDVLDRDRSHWVVKAPAGRPSNGMRALPTTRTGAPSAGPRRIPKSPIRAASNSGTRAHAAPS